MRSLLLVIVTASWPGRLVRSVLDDAAGRAGDTRGSDHDAASASGPRGRRMTPSAVSRIFTPAI